jgi:hypothetical protein
MLFDVERSPESFMFEALARAEDRLSRLDERAKLCGFHKGWQSRADVRATLAATWLDGFVIKPEDLILHDLGMDARVPERDVVRAAGMLRARRKATRDPGPLLSWRGVLWLLGRAASPPGSARPSLAVGDPVLAAGRYAQLDAYLTRLARGDEEDPRAGVEDCLAALDAGGPGTSPVLLAALLLEAWRVVDPLPSQRWLGALLAAVWLLSAGRFSVGLVPIEAGLRRRGRMPVRLTWASAGERLAWWLEGIALACDLELEEITRLAAKRVLLERRVAGRRVHSRARALGVLVMDQVVVSTPIIAGALNITPQAARLLVSTLGDLLQEITGRARYQVWRF